MNTATFYMVTFKSADGVISKELFIGNTPLDAHASCKQSNPKCTVIRVGKTAYNTFGEKI